MGLEEKFTELPATTIHETELAVLLDIGHDENKWVPKSVLEDWPDVGENGEILILTSWAFDMGFI